MKRLFLVVLALLALVAGVISCTSTLAPTPGPSPTPTTIPSPSLAQTPASTQLITKKASELVLTLSDFPAGWTLHREEITESGYLKRTFVHGRIYPTPLICQVKVFSTVNEAKEEYVNMFSQVSETYSYDIPQVGDEGFAYEEVGNRFRSVIRRKNVIGIIDMVGVIENMTDLFFDGSLSDVEDYAAKLDKKIS